MRYLFRLLFPLLLLTMGCLLEEQTGARKALGIRDSGNTKPENSNDVSPPNFSSDHNYFQDGAHVYHTLLDIDREIDRALYMRGREIHDYLEKQETRDQPLCLVQSFETRPGTSKILLLAAIANTFPQLGGRAREHYFLIRPNNEAINKNCQNASLLNALDLIHGSKPIIYRLRDLCSNCAETQYHGLPLSLFRLDGTKVDAISVGHIRATIFNTPERATSGNPSCRHSGECELREFDCCLNGQCVNDKSIKLGIDQSSPEFEAIAEQIVFNPSLITDYTNIYNICPLERTSVETVEASFDPYEDLDSRLKEKKELYDCINPMEGELSLCTVTYSTKEEGINDDDGVTFQTGRDDLNFQDTYRGSFTNLFNHSIHKVTYGGVTLFENNAFTDNHLSIGGVRPPGEVSNILGNNNFTESLDVKIFHDFVLPPSAKDERIKITYKTNGSCIRINKNLGKCKKVYIQGQNLGKVTDHHPSTNSFRLPFYADPRRPLRVSVDDVMRTQNIHWNLVRGRNSQIQFRQPDNSVYNTQKVEITFYVNLDDYNVLQIVEKSRDKVREICGNCRGEDCNFTPLLNSEDHIIDYECFYPHRGTSPPFFKTFQMSSKTVPVRYFDTEGAYHPDINGDTPPQEGTAFLYEDSSAENPWGRPNNLDQYIGFNEIYGSLSGQIQHGANPAKEIVVEKGKSYDIFTDRSTGGFSSCFYCGNDYWSHLLRLFPRSFTDNGGGFTPNSFETNPARSETYRKDDILFGRACFVPVTMIPWTHRPHDNRQTQRQNRLNAQHFLFANGYQRDWYGFDYGSIIGSWNGLVWFSIGNQRKVVAKSNRLFLAVNAYWGDLTNEGDFTITVQESIHSVANSGSMVTSDFESDGAECQKYHTCNVDQDCIAKLGWDYACESILELQSPWPNIDDYGMEIAATGERLRRLRYLFGQLHGPKKRCIYRGRGTPCHRNYTNVDPDNTFNKSGKSRHLVCSANNYCQSFGGLNKEAKFNTRIARSRRGPTYQNRHDPQREEDFDTFGLHTRLIGRPMDWNGSEVIPDNAQENFTYNGMRAICVPGREPQDNMESMNNNAPLSSKYTGDKALGIGVTADETSDNYFAACPVLDPRGNLIHFDHGTTNLSALDASLDGIEFQSLSSMQNTSTNALEFLEEARDNGAIEDNVINYADFDSETVTKPKLELNRCLRMPGSVCHSDYDCASSEFITKVTRVIQPDDLSLNPYELNFWKETLICSQKGDIRSGGFQSLGGRSEDHALENNRCCREVGRDLTIGVYKGSSSVFEDDIAGIEIDIDNRRRYSLYNVVGDMVSQQNYPYTLFAPAGNECSTNCVRKNLLEDQYKIFPTIPERVCCNGHWVRQFHRSNGGGHHWEARKHQQNFEIESFKCYNWIDINKQPNIIGETRKNAPFTCRDSESILDLDCGARSVPIGEAERILEWISILELVGIPQASMVHPTSGSDEIEDLLCKVNPANQTAPTTSFQKILPNVFRSSSFAITAIAEIGNPNTPNEEYFSLGDENNFDSDHIKQVFSEDKVTCCIPAGQRVPTIQNIPPDQEKCCTGYISPATGRCALRDYTNVSVHFNRFVSSALRGVHESQFDSNGFLKSTAKVERLACQKEVCASGVIARGVAWTHTIVPGAKESEGNMNIRQFLDSENMTEDDRNGLARLFKAGLKWNTHVYCVPTNIADASEFVLTRCTQDRQ